MEDNVPVSQWRTQSWLNIAGTGSPTVRKNWPADMIKIKLGLKQFIDLLSACICHAIGELHVQD